MQLVQRGDQLPFDQDSFDYLGTIAKAELALVASKDAPFDDLEGMVAYAKEQGTLAIATMAPPQVLMMKATTRAKGADFNLVTADGGAEVIVRSPYQDDRPSVWLSDRTGIPAIVLPLTVGGTDEASDLFSLYDDVIDRLLGAIQ